MFLWAGFAKRLPRIRAPKSIFRAYSGLFAIFTLQYIDVEWEHRYSAALPCNILNRMLPHTLTKELCSRS